MSTHYEQRLNLSFLISDLLIFRVQQLLSFLKIYLDFLPISKFIKYDTYPYLITTLSGITAPAATRPPDSTLAWRTVAPIDTNDQSSKVDPWRIVFGPTNTSLPIVTSLERWALSWITQLSPILIGFRPRIVAPYQIDELNPTFTLPIIVEFGAIKSAY